MRVAYIPVSITFDDNGNVTNAEAGDYEAPWMYVGSQPDVWAEQGNDEFEWVRDEDTIGEACEWLQQILDGLEYDVG